MPATTTTATMAMVIRCVSERLASSFFIYPELRPRFGHYFDRRYRRKTLGYGLRLLSDFLRQARRPVLHLHFHDFLVGADHFVAHLQEHVEAEVGPLLRQNGGVQLAAFA